MNISANREFSDLSLRNAEASLLGSPPTLAISGPRIITLASLSAAIPDRFICQTLAQFVHSETNESVLLVEVDAAGPGVSPKEFAARQPALNGELCFAEHLRDSEGGFKRLNLRLNSDPRELGAIELVLRHFASHFRFILLRIGAEGSDQALLEFLSRSEET